MFKLIKIKDTDNVHDNYNVKMTIPGNEVTLPEFLEVATQFILACGYSLPEGHNLGVLEDSTDCPCKGCESK